MIKLNNITKVFNGSFKAVDELSVEFSDGEIIGLIGPNGAGKSTTMKMITGIINPTEGNININGFDITKQPIEAKKQFSFVSDSPDAFLRLKGIEYLNFIANIYQVDKQIRNEKINKLSKDFAMDEVLNDQIKSYSHGMRQKIMIIGALLHEPNVWILDEPLTGLDPQSAFLLKEKMREHAALGNTIIFSTHVLEVAEKLCSKVCIINKGKQMFFGTLDELKSKYADNLTLEELFFKVTADE
ncbi:MAG: ABC transporter ATP-binding protein [Erysipelotrichaceae bacterium]